MKNNNGFYIGLSLLIVVITQRILDFIGISKVSIFLIVIILMTSSIVFTVIAIRKNEIAKKIKIMFSTIMLSVGLSLSASVILIDGFPQFSDKHVTLTMIIVLFGILSFFAEVIFWVWNTNKYSKKS